VSDQKRILNSKGKGHAFPSISSSLITSSAPISVVVFRYSFLCLLTLSTLTSDTLKHTLFLTHTCHFHPPILHKMCYQIKPRWHYNNRDCTTVINSLVSITIFNYILLKFIPISSCKSSFHPQFRSQGLKHIMPLNFVNLVSSRIIF